MPRRRNRAVDQILTRESLPVQLNRCSACRREFEIASLRQIEGCPVCPQCEITVKQRLSERAIEQQVRQRDLKSFAAAFETTVDAIREVAMLLLIPRSVRWRPDEEISLQDRQVVYHGMKRWTDYSASGAVTVHSGFLATVDEHARLASRGMRMRALARRESLPRDEREQAFARAFAKPGKDCDDSKLWRRYVAWCESECRRIDEHDRARAAQRSENFNRVRQERRDNASSNIEDPLAHAEWRELDRNKNDHS